MTVNVSILSADDLPHVPFVLEGISARFIREKKIIPLELKDNRLKVLMADPDWAVVDALRVAVAPEVEIFTADPQVIEDYLSKFYGQEAQDINQIIDHLDDADFQFIRDDDEDSGTSKISPPTPPSSSWSMPSSTGRSNAGPAISISRHSRPM